MDDEKDLTLKALVEKSETIVIGKLISMRYPTIQLGNFTKDKPGFNVAKIEVSKVLKGDQNLKIVSLAMPHAINLGKGLDKWKSPIFTCDLEGLWFLNKDPRNVPREVIQAVKEKGDYYFASTRGRFKKLNDNLIKEINALIFGNSSTELP